MPDRSSTLSARREMLPVAERRLLRRRRLLLMQTKRAEAGDWPAVRDVLD